MIHVPAERLKGLPRTVPEIREWIRSLGGRPVSRREKALLVATGNWGMPEE